MLILTPNDFSLQAPTPTSVLDWTRSPNGHQLGEHGSCSAALLPADDDVVLVLPPRAVSWHWIELPKVAANRLRAALDGLLEDRLLSETGELHFALEPGKRSGQALWVAVCRKDWLQAWLQVLDGAGHPVSRIVPSAWPSRPDDASASVHWAFAQLGRAWLVSASPDGVVTLPIPNEGQMAVSDTSENSQWWAEPAVVAQVERALDRRPAMMPLPAWLLRSAQSEWNLAQFDVSLSSRARQGQRLKQTLRHLMSAPTWRPARWGLIALLLSLLGGLNAMAWMERNSQQDKQRATTQLLKKAFPDVGVVLDAPVQMRRELVRLQQSSGVLSHDDLEAMLAATAELSAGQAPSSIEFSPGDVRLAGWPVPEEQLKAIQQGLEQRGWRASLEGGVLRIQPRTPG